MWHPRRGAQEGASRPGNETGPSHGTRNTHHHDFQRTGSIMPMISHLSLDTCPGGLTDSAFVVISEAELFPSAVAELAAFWRPLLDRCGSAALQSWYDRALVTVLYANDPAARAHFLEFLPTDLSAESRATLWRAAEREPVGSLLRGHLACRAVRSRDTGERIAWTIHAFLLVTCPRIGSTRNREPYSGAMSRAISGFSPVSRCASMIPGLRSCSERSMPTSGPECSTGKARVWGRSDGRLLEAFPQSFEPCGVRLRSGCVGRPPRLDHLQHQPRNDREGE